MSLNKLKVLFFGEIGDNAEQMSSKVAALHTSKAGPFDAAICVGTTQLSRSLLMDLKLPIPVYLHAVELEDGLEITAAIEQQQESPVLLLAPNLYLLQDAKRSFHEAVQTPVSGIWSIPIVPKHPELVIAACPAHLRVDSPAGEPLATSLRHVSYRGCDVLLTFELPQGIEKILVENAPAVSYDTADIALLARARYHFVSPHATYQQSPPFGHLSATTNTSETLHTGRLITLAPFSSSKDKSLKSVHALSLTPLLAMSANDLAQQQKPVVTCPYTDASYPTDGPRASMVSSKSTTMGMSEARARRILAEEQQRHVTSAASRWAGNKRSRDKDHIAAATDPSVKTLFLHGLHKDVSGQLQSAGGDIVILQAFRQPWQATKIRKPPAASTSFCFVEFPTHELALQCITDTGGEVTILGVHLTIKWAATPQSNKKPTNAAPEYERLTEGQAKDSSTIYFKLSSDNMAEAGEALRLWMQTVLENALNDGGTETTDRVTADDEPALRVTVRVQETYGFLEFASHAAASMAVATVTGSTDGGAIRDDSATGWPEMLSGRRIYLNWAQNKQQSDEAEHNVIEDASSGFKFERKHFPADSRQDCWFCLASETCEKHLITGVFETSYAAMPKGPIHPGHVLLIPVTHTSQGALKDSAVATELEELKQRLRRHAASAYECDLFVFERAIQTKGGYHTHVQCVPVQKQLGLKLQTTMLIQAKKCGMDLREVNSDVALSAILSDSDDDDGYFYAEIPVSGMDFKRFLYRSRSGGGGVRVPLQFGREILAAVYENPDLAHWKSCVVDAKQEAEIAKQFRDSFATVE